MSAARRVGVVTVADRLALGGALGGDPPSDAVHQARLRTEGLDLGLRLPQPRRPSACLLDRDELGRIELAVLKRDSTLRMVMFRGPCIQRRLLAHRHSPLSSHRHHGQRGTAAPATGAGETLLQGELKAAKGELRVEIGASESRLGLRLDKILARIDTINHRFDKAKGRAS